MDQYRDKFQGLLRELFQFDCADLDFGIYRIMNYKRDVIDKFISTDLPKAIATELDRGALADQSQAAKELTEVAKQITESLGKDALDADGRLAEAYHATPLGKKYLDLKGKAAGGRGRQALEATIFNHLHTFFSRYYQDGDFISKRRYSKRQRYAIPYNGEEVYLHWANHDQYYVKTAEHFHDYSFTSRGVTVHFKIKAANVEQNNVKGDTRFFIPRVKEINWDEKASQLVIPFEYRPLTDQEAVTYGTKNQQDKIIADAVDSIPKRLKKADKALLAVAVERHKNSDGQPVSFLEHHLRQYTRRNTSDFFIHKDLKGFLCGELDFYLKNEVLNLDEMETAGEDRCEGWFQVMQVVKAVGSRIIDFLDQIESFQKMLWEKRKFITETQYCITVGTIEESFYPDIAACDAQWAEWKELFHIDEEQSDLFSNGKSKKDRRIAFLKAHPTLVLDTARFETAWVDRLLGSIEDVDGKTDGHLLHADNFQALALLQDRHRHAIECIHIDPPYNTATSGFLYKNEYQHSSWLAMMRDRIEVALPLFVEDGAFQCHIDENEYEVLFKLFDKLGLPNAGTIVWDKKNPMLGRKGIATQHEYIIWRGGADGVIYLRNTSVQKILKAADEIIAKHGGVNEASRQEYAQWINACDDLTGGEKAYRLLNDDGRVFQSVAMGAPELRTNPKFHIPLIHPITGKECPVPSNGWSRAPETIQQLIDAGEIVFGKDETTQPRKKVFLTTESKRQVSSVIEETGRGKQDVLALGLEFPYCHPVSLYETLLGGGLSANGTALDFFAGSGTTGHAVINLNRADQSGRKFILVEMGGYFDTVTLPRIKKVTFAPAWKDGKPQRMATVEEAKRSPRIVKYVRLESYEDTLNNISFDDASGQGALKFDDYLLKYMLKWETRKSETLLNVEKLVCPFAYKLTVMKDGESVDRTVDVPETFNYLLGLHVSTRKVYDADGRRYLVYRGRIDHRQVVVIWRDTDGWQKRDLERDKKFVADQKLTEGADEVFVNGDSFIPNARALEPVFKARMFSTVEA